MLTQSPLAKRQHDFFDTINAFFPIVYDVKYLMKSCRNLKGGLQELADDLDVAPSLSWRMFISSSWLICFLLKVKRVGPQHQAGSDSMLTMAVFFKMKRLYFEDNIDDEKYCGVLYGLGTCDPCECQSADSS